MAKMGRMSLGLMLGLFFILINSNIVHAESMTNLFSAGAEKVMNESVLKQVGEASASAAMHISDEEATKADIDKLTKSEGGGLTGYGSDDGTYGGYTNLGIANVDNWLNVRKEPKEEGEIIGKMPKHAGCEVLDVTDDGYWAHVKSGKVEGYASTEYLLMGDEAIKIAPDCIKLLATVTTTTLYVRSEPTTESSVVTMVPMEEELDVEEDLDGWVKITIDEDEGYISKDYVHISEKFDSAVTISELKYGMGVSELRVNMVKFAMKYLGHRYVWGGTSLANGTDCSGFTMGIYRNFGISLPRVSRSQATVGKKITASELKPGDLIFYGKGSYINHVAMYIGNGQIIHAANKKSGIKISNAFYRTPVTMRRIISD